VALDRTRDPLDPLDLANMRQNGVRSLLVMSHGCRHKAIVNVDMYPGRFLVLDFGSRIVCSKWGIVGADVAELERAEQVRRARH